MNHDFQQQTQRVDQDVPLAGNWPIGIMITVVASSGFPKGTTEEYDKARAS